MQAHGPFANEKGRRPLCGLSVTEVISLACKAVLAGTPARGELHSPCRAAGPKGPPRVCLHPIIQGAGDICKGSCARRAEPCRAPASARLLLGDAVHVSAAVHYLQRVHAHHFLIRENGGKLLQRQGVVFIAELRHNDAAVHNEEI